MKDGYGLLYDFEEKTFYSTRNKSKKSTFKPYQSIWYFIAIIALRNIDNYISIEKKFQSNMFIVLFGIIITTVIAYKFYIKAITPWLGNQTVKAYISESELNELIIKARRKIRLQIFIVFSFVVVFTVFFALFIIYVKVVLLIISLMMWFCMALILFSAHIYQKIYFFNKYKKGEILL
ncbi:MAG: hypothetical protein FWC09_05130, partial [Lachnospiraceae bacterium]|nr:hypothetical protein [Lachnospiraceae bacterium]